MLLYRATLWFFRTAAASSSPSIAWRDRDLAGPTESAQQLRGGLDGVPAAEQAADQRRDPTQCPSLTPSLAHCSGLSLSRHTGPLDLSASVPPSRQAASTSAATRCDPQVARDLIDPVTDTVFR